VSGGGVKCWGSNWYGQLGIGSSTVTNLGSPVDVAGDGRPLDTPRYQFLFFTNDQKQIIIILVLLIILILQFIKM
jgi:hypothetical protein